MPDQAENVLAPASLSALAQAARLILEAVGQAGPLPSHSLSSLSPSLTLADLINEFYLAKARQDVSAGYWNQVHVTCRLFAKGREFKPLWAIGSAEIESWLYSYPWKPRTRLGKLIDVRALFGFAVRRGYLVINPALGVDRPKVVPDAAYQVHTPEQVRHVLETARARDPNLMRCLAIRYFAGARTAEVHRLEEADIRTGQGVIVIEAAKAKTRARRILTIRPNLAAWLDLGGELPLRQVNNRLADFTKAVGVPWPKNVCRHSFCSYHLAHWRNAAETALEAGHSEAMLFAHYRELVSREDAAEFWEIRPERKSS